jgi:hypothetical protein
MKLTKILTCLKQNGMARTPTPMMLFAKVITVPVLVPIVMSNSSNLLYINNSYSRI